jgi:hypothetical protein
MQIMLDMKRVKLHSEALIFWHYKSALQFYNDSLLVIIKISSSHADQEMRRRRCINSVYLNERSHCHTIRRSSPRKIRWHRLTTQSDCCLYTLN